VESLAIANTGFIGLESEILLPQGILESIVNNITFTTTTRILADGTRVSLRKTVEPLDVYVVEEDRVEGPVKAKALVSRAGSTLLNDKLLSELRIAIIDPGRGLWCFIDEIGRATRRSY